MGMKTKARIQHWCKQMASVPAKKKRKTGMYHIALPIAAAAMLMPQTDAESQNSVVGEATGGEGNGPHNSHNYCASSTICP